MGSSAIHRAVAWIKPEPFGVEFAELRISRRQLSANGVAIGTAPVPYRLDYLLETRAGFVTSRLHVTSRGEGWTRELDLRHAEDGSWSVDAHAEGQVDLPPAGGDAGLLAGALDCDLELSPVTNMMPILRHGLLHTGGPLEFTMAWIAAPSLSVEPDGQRYRHLRSSGGHHVVRFEATDETFAADITLDSDAVVVDYPAIARRLPESAPAAVRQPALGGCPPR